MNEFSTLNAAIIQNARSVAANIDLLRAAIDSGDDSGRTFASGIVAEAAGQYAGHSTAYRQYGFDQISAAVTPREAVPNLATDLLAGALLDLGVADSVITAGRAAGEAPENPATLEEVDAARARLEDLTRQLVPGLSRPAGAPQVPGRFGFDEAPAPKLPPQSQSHEEAKSNYAQRCDEFFADLVDRTKQVLQSAYEGLTKIPGDKVTQALSLLGQGVAGAVPRFGSLIQRGMEIASKALDKLNGLLHLVEFNQLREKARELLNNVTGGQGILDAFLKRILHVDGFKNSLRQMLDATSADAARIDRGSGNLISLQSQFSEQAALNSRIIGFLNTSKTISGYILPVLLAHAGPAGQAAPVLVFAAFYLTVMVYIVLVAMDFADAAGPLNFVEGVARISQSALA